MRNSVKPMRLPLERRAPPAPCPGLQVWGGIECTITRVQDHYRNQVLETGHHDRLDDLHLIAKLGIRILRYPVLWETISPNHPDETDFRWHDWRLGKLRTLGIAPIAGLMHHGSGPKYTSLLEPEFPELLARHASRVAARYPWIGMFTPVNEPVTTARFSGLYGHWYPHHRSESSFLRALVNQCTAVTLAMRAIRQVTPCAKLVQTEDLGKTFSTPLLRRQAQYENERRWLSFDLLCGRIKRSHPWYDRLLNSGISHRELARFVEEPCRPDIIGINHYLTSERFLDERMQDYPRCFWGGNPHLEYADVEAVRVARLSRFVGPAPRLREAWRRYRLPMAVTEAHHGSSREEQLRWLMEVWTAARRLRDEGMDLRAVTVWSLLGAIDWNCLLTRRVGFYEAGAYDVRGKEPRPTAIARAAAALVQSGTYDHPVLDALGWWRREGRCYHQPKRWCRTRQSAARQLLITGSNGGLGRAFKHICQLRGINCVGLSRRELDIAESRQVATALGRYRPWAVINAAGYEGAVNTRHELESCRRDNVQGPETLALSCARFEAKLVSFSSDRVFDGALGRAYTEGDRVCPEDNYGESKVEAEQRVIKVLPDALLIRSSVLFSPLHPENGLGRTLRGLACGARVELSTAELVSPTYVPDLVNATLDLLVDDERGTWHLANKGEFSWYDVVQKLLKITDIKPAQLLGIAGPRRNRALTSERAVLLPDLENALWRYVREIRAL
jgi:dTDP-4-dehydrorhamnose reductase